jgi:hypothetical protein
MSGKTLWNPEKEPHKASWDLAAEELGLGRTCPSRVTGTRPGTRTCLARLSRIRSETRISPVFLGLPFCG